jgi:hypothetical protein
LAGQAIVSWIEFRVFRINIRHAQWGGYLLHIPDRQRMRIDWLGASGGCMVAGCRRHSMACLALRRWRLSRAQSLASQDNFIKAF